MSVYRKILTKYWGYDSFRPLQEEIIETVAEGKDCLGLMPTGGGKSITFQVFSLSQEGICLVITPLIALMKDQVANLKKRKIKAAAIYSGMSLPEIEVSLSNCILGDFKFLYISPERLQTELFQDALREMKVNLICVDEAHCISQWGYDFRPSYLKIADIRAMLPETPVLALTATATPSVLDDIQEKLQFKEHCVLRKSFERKNLAYIVRETDDKPGQLADIIKKIPGTGIVYVRNRKKTRELAASLARKGFKASHYHAGLSREQRENKQDLWQNGKLRLLVSTNAFGMGIDKPDVRFVIHYDLPDSLEAYFQEAGRAGRDGKKAWAILLYNQADVSNLEKRLKSNFPALDKVRKVYDAICNYFQIPVGAGKDISYDFDMFDFAKKFSLDSVSIYYSLKVLEKQGYLQVTEELNKSSQVHFTISREDLYHFQVANKNFDSFIKLILRSYPGLFTQFTPINEAVLARRANTKLEVIVEYLKLLQKLKIIKYIPRKNTPMLLMLTERLYSKNLMLDPRNYKERKQRFKSRIDAVLHYAMGTAKCRSQSLLEYFGEKNAKRCGMCDVCQRRNELELSRYEFDLILSEIKRGFSSESIYLNELVKAIKHQDDKVIKVIQWLFDNDKIYKDSENKLRWVNK